MASKRYQPATPGQLERLRELRLRDRFTAREERMILDLVRRENLEQDELERVFEQGLRSVFTNLYHPMSSPSGVCSGRLAVAEALWDRGIGHARFTFYDEYLGTVPPFDVEPSPAFPLVALVDPNELFDTACAAGGIANVQAGFPMVDGGYGGADPRTPYWIAAQVGLRHLGVSPRAYAKIRPADEEPLSAFEGVYLAILHPDAFKRRNVDLARSAYVERPDFNATMESWTHLQPPLVGWRWSGETRLSFCLGTRRAE